MARLLAPSTDLLPDPLTDERIVQLGERGYFLVDDFLGREAALRLRGEALALAASGALRPAGVSRGEAYRLDRSTRGDEFCWLDPAEAPPAIAAWLEALVRLRDALNARAFLGLRRHEVQIARYAGGGVGYVRHLDAFPGPPNRVVTAIYYLNEGWEPAHGGALRLFLEDGTMRDVAPRLDRLLVFRSARVEHEVLPVWAERLAITAWFYCTEPLPP